VARAERYELQGVARSVLGVDHRIRGCLRYRHFGAATVAVRNRRDTGQAYYSGLQVCGVAAACPCCGARIAEERARRVELAIAAWASTGGQVALVTLTFSHHAGQALEPNLDALLAAYRALVRGGSYRRLKARYGLAHFIKGVELTWSAVNGWHPHLHVLGFFAGAFDAVAFERELWALWLAQLGRVGRSCTRAYGLKVQQGFTNAHKYVTKIGRQWGLADELARANQKRGRGGATRRPICCGPAGMGRSRLRRRSSWSTSRPCMGGTCSSGRRGWRRWLGWSTSAVIRRWRRGWIRAIRCWWSSMGRGGRRCGKLAGLCGCSTSPMWVMLRQSGGLWLLVKSDIL
jgi:hypothetical protein